MRRRWWFAALGFVALTACSSDGGVPTGSGARPPGKTPCAPAASGALCITLVTAHHEVQDVIGYLSASNSPLAGQDWRLVLSAYPCRPGTAASPACAPSGSYPGPVRHGVPPASTHCVTQHGAVVSDAPGCHDTLAEQLAIFGDWSGFAPHGLPVTFAHKTWLCVTEQIRTGETWAVAAGSEATAPVRACASPS